MSATWRLETMLSAQSMEIQSSSPSALSTFLILTLQLASLLYPQRMTESVSSATNTFECMSTAAWSRDEQVELVSMSLKAECMRRKGIGRARLLGRLKALPVIRGIPENNMPSHGFSFLWVAY